MKKGITIFLFLLAAVTVLFVSCKKKETATAMELVIMNGTEPQSLDPSQVQGVPEHRINLALFEGLVRYDPRTAKAVPGVAESWSFSNNDSVITFKIREGAVWSDGTPITAQTFVDSWLHHLNPDTASEYAYLIGMIVVGADDYNIEEGRPEDVAIRAVDSRTFEITMFGPSAYAIDLIAHYAFNPLPVHIIRQYGNNWTRVGNFVGNGPFVLQEHIPNSRIVVVPNDRYWDKANVHLTKIIFDATEDDNTMYQAYISGEADWSTGVPLTRIDEVKLRSDYQASPQLATYYFEINNRDWPALRDARVRKALSMAINRQEIVDSILKAGQIPATALVPPIGSYTPTTGNGFNVNEAKRLLAEAGYPDGAGFPTFEVVYNSGVEGHRLISEYLQQTWKNNLGVDTRLANMEWASFLDYRQTPSMQIARAGWVADYMDPQNFLELLITDTGNNDGHYSDAEFDRLMSQAAAMPDGPERFSLMRQAEDIAITRDQAMIPLYYYVNQNLIDLTKWDGWYQNPMDVHPYVGLRKK